MSKFSLVLNGAASIVKETAKKIAYHKHTLSLADSPCHDDLYIVSFPKSGATWVDFLMANIHLKMSGDKRLVNFYNIHTIIPDVHYCRHVRVTPLPFPGFRVMKSHAAYNPYYKNVIYIIRDPRDVMVSYYKFLVGLGEFSGSVSDLIRSPKYGIETWINHVEEWHYCSPASMRIIFVRYEDLKSNTYATLRGLYEAIGFVIPDEVLNIAIEESSFDKMKLLERAWNYGGRPVGDNFTFMRKGVSGAWENTLTDDDLVYVRTVSEKYLNKFGYIK